MDGSFGAEWAKVVNGVPGARIGGITLPGPNVPDSNVWYFFDSFRCDQDSAQGGLTVGVAGSASGKLPPIRCFCTKKAAQNSSVVYWQPNSNRITVKGCVYAEFYFERWHGLKDHARSEADKYVS